MPHELRIPFMEAKEPVIVIEGLEEIIKKDLERHKVLLTRSKVDLTAFKVAIAHQIKKKKHYKSLIGGGKFNDDSLRKSMTMIGIDIRHMSDKVKFAEEAVAHHGLIVDTLIAQLSEQYKKLVVLAEYREKDKCH